MDNQLIHNYIKDLLINLASASPMTIYQTCILGSLISLDPKYVIFSLLALIFGDGFNFIEKKFSKKLCGDVPICNRPLFLDGTGSVETCGVFQKYHLLNSLDKLKTHSFGMPSGHSQLVALTATFWSLYQIGHLKQETNKNKRNMLISSIVIICVLALLVMYQRYYTRCHNIEQIVIGASLGILFGFLAYIIASNIDGVNIPDINNILYNNNEDDIEDDENDSENDDDNNEENSEINNTNNERDNKDNILTLQPKQTIKNINNKNLTLELQKYEKERNQQDLNNIHINNSELDNIQSNNLII